ncbi:hypothetical protein Bca52824_025962 [Brassica carinata]|uniref:Uncharacterized protein n=1 Tax=Brassica carinata TaxID=52824 RepID=A0A8X7SFQ8_BRACI|nr:hypothetical protein Bca52824_025962 [Brassica carinata]
MPPTSDPLKLFMEDIEKTQTLSGKYAKIQTYIVSLKEEKSKITDLDRPISKQFLDHAIKTLEVEHDFVSEKIKNILNETGITNVDVLPEEMIRVFQNPSLNQNNTVPQAPQVPMQSQQGLGQQGSLQTKLQQNRQLLQQQQGLLTPGQMNPQMQAQGMNSIQMQQQRYQLQQLILKQNQMQQQQGLLQ